MVENLKLKQIVHFLKLKHIKISEQNEWLQGCCEYYYSNNNSATNNIQDVQNFVYDQWLLADLRDIGEKVLPSNILNIGKMCITENLALQVDSVLNVNKSAYSQLQQLRNNISSNLNVGETKAESWQPNSGRILKLTLTDGVQTIYGMEYASISALKEPFIPGFKILIAGPIECRRGILFLKPQNIQILGGETDSLVIKNATENVLARILNMEENPNPFNKQEINEIVEENDLTISNSNLPSTNDNENSMQVSNLTEVCNFLNDDDDDIFLCDQLTQIENQIVGNNNCNTVNTKTSSATSNVNDNNLAASYESFVDNTLRNTKEFSSAFSSVALASNGVQNGSSKKDRTPVGVACPIISTNIGSVKRTMKSPSDPISKILRGIESTSNTVPSHDQTNLSYGDTSRFLQLSKNEQFNDDNNSRNKIFAQPIMTVKEIKNQINQNLIVACKAEVVKLTTKPRIRNEMWQLSAEIKDNTDILEIEFSDSFVENIFGYAAVEIASQKERIKINTNVKEKIDKILKSGVQKILILNGIFQLKLESESDLPRVINVT